jgi:hypothetical protein
MKCPKCAEKNKGDSNYCSNCGTDIFELKELKKKSIKDISSTDLINSYPGVVSQCKIDDWVNKVMKKSFSSRISLFGIHEKVFGDIMEGQQFEYDVVLSGYYYRATEDMISKEDVDFEKIKINDPKKYKTKEDWLLDNSKKMNEAEIENRDLILKHAIIFDNEITNPAQERLFHNVIGHMLADKVKMKLSDKVGKALWEIVEYDFYMGYWIRFFESYYKFKR